MKITLLYLGKPDTDIFRAGIADFESRIRRYLPFEVIQVPPVKYPSSAGIREKKTLESAKLNQQLNPADIVILLDENGKEMTSAIFADYLVKLQNRHGKRLVFIIGGPYGFDEVLRERSVGTVSLSKMTFPHQMARLVFLEQLYRACTIINHEPYHHE
jgi:23S rRNA (pseudouridine1915-N3)-methyltransferase